MTGLLMAILSANAIVPELPSAYVVTADAERAWVLDPRVALLDRPQGAPIRELHLAMEVQVVDLRDGHAQIEVSGHRGWVDLRFLSAVPLELHAMRRWARAADTPEARLAWAERAAATSHGGYDHRVLASALHAVGARDRASAIEASLGLAPEIWLAPIVRAPDLRIEYAVSGAPPRPTDGPLSAEELPAYGLAPGQSWWVLPVDGPAVLGRVTGASASVINECGGSWAVEVHLDADLPDGTEVVAFARGEPPASWREPAPAPVGRDAVVERVRRRAEALGLRDPQIDVAGAGTHWWARAATVLSTEDDGLQHVRVVDLVWDGAALRVLEDDQFATWSGWSRPFAARDLDGDGDLESIWTECSRVVRDGAGEWIASTESRCCGC